MQFTAFWSRCEIPACEALQWEKTPSEEWINPNKHFPEDDIKDDAKTKRVGDALQSTALQLTDDDHDGVTSRWMLLTIITAVIFLVALTANQVVFDVFQANRDGYER